MRLQSQICRIPWLLTMAAYLWIGCIEATAAPPTSRPTKPALTQELQDTIGRYIRKMMRRHSIPGVAVTVVHKQQIVYAKGFGTTGRKGQKITPETPFLLGSMSKAFTATAIVQLVQAGKIGLDDPVKKHLPDLAMRPKGWYQKLTIRHLLHHTSGLRRTSPMADEGAPLEQHAKALRGCQLHTRPGKVHSYASQNYQLLGHLVAKYGGGEYGTYIKHHVFRPLQMKRSFVSRKEARSHGMAMGHRYWFGTPRPGWLPDERGRRPTASLMASARDMGHFLIANLNGGRYQARQILSPKGIAMLHAPGAKGKGFWYGMGWRRGPIKGIPTIHHAIHHGGILPDFRGKMILLPTSGWGVVLLTNSGSFFGKPYSHVMANAIAGATQGRKLRITGFRLRTQYLLIWLIFGLLFFNQLQHLWKLRTFSSRVEEQLDEGTSRWKLWISVVSHGIFPLIILVVVPLYVGIALPYLFKHVPDIGWYISVAIAIDLFLLLVQGILVGQAMRRRATSNTTSSHTA